MHGKWLATLVVYDRNMPLHGAHVRNHPIVDWECGWWLPRMERAVCDMCRLSNLLRYYFCHFPCGNARLLFYFKKMLDGKKKLAEPAR